MNETEQEQERKKAIEKANAYREMSNGWAFQDLAKTVLWMKEEEAGKMDVLELDQSVSVKMAESRGIRKGLQRVLDEVGYVIGQGDFK